MTETLIEMTPQELERTIVKVVKSIIPTLSPQPSSPDLWMPLSKAAEVLPYSENSIRESIKNDGVPFPVIWYQPQSIGVTLVHVERFKLWKQYGLEPYFSEWLVGWVKADRERGNQ